MGLGLANYAKEEGDRKQNHLVLMFPSGLVDILQ
jgi:hypothetical protein